MNPPLPGSAPAPVEAEVPVVSALPTLFQDDVGPVRWLTIVRPEVHNALNAAVFAELSASLDEIEASPWIGAVVLTGAGERAFSAGADLDELAVLDANEALATLVAGGRVFDRLERLSVPVIAAVNGLALGGGFELALASTLVMASENALFGLPETRLGLMPGYGGTQRLADFVGVAHARAMIVTGESVTAADAYRLGLLHDAPVAPDELRGAVQRRAESIASNGRVAVARARAALRARSSGAEAAFLLESCLAALCVASDEAAVRVSSFLDGRRERKQNGA